MSAVHATIRYNTLRLAMVILVGGVAYLLGARGFAVVMIAFFVSLPLSFILLARWRQAMIEEIAGKRVKNPVRVLGERLEARAAAEDAALEADAAQDTPPREGDHPPAP